MASPLMKTLTALRLVKDKREQVGDKTKFPITKELLADVNTSCTVYEAVRVAKKVAQKAELRKKNQKLLMLLGRLHTKRLRKWRMIFLKLRLVF